MDMGKFLQHGLGYKFLSYELLKAIYEQMEELKEK